MLLLDRAGGRCVMCIGDLPDAVRLVRTWHQQEQEQRDAHRRSIGRPRAGHTGGRRARRDLDRELEAIRRRGHAIVHRKGHDALSAVAAPILDHTGSVKATVGLAMPCGRFRGLHRAATIEGVVSTAAQISAALGHDEVTTEATDTR